MKKIVFAIMIVSMSVPAFAAGLTGIAGLVEPMKNYLTVDNVLAAIGAVSVLMTGVPVPKAGTWLYKMYTVLKYFGGNFGFADHTKK